MVLYKPPNVSRAQFTNSVELDYVLNRMNVTFSNNKRLSRIVFVTDCNEEDLLSAMQLSNFFMATLDNLQNCIQLEIDIINYINNLNEVDADKLGNALLDTNNHNKSMEEEK